MKVWEWVKRRWFDVRQGYSQYISIALAYVNFVLIISVKFPSESLTLLMLTIGTAAVCVSMAVGYLHRNHQMKTDMDSQFEQSRLASKLWLVWIHMLEGTATPEEIKWAKGMLERIAKP